MIYGFNLDKYFIKKEKIRSSTNHIKSVVQKFKLQQERVQELDRLYDEENDASFDVDESERQKNLNLKEFKKQIKSMVLFNEKALRRAYLHPF